MFGPYQAIRCADGYLTLGAANKRTWERLAQALGRPDLVDRPEYAEAEDRVRNRHRLAEEIEAVTASQPRAHWMRVLDDAGVPCGPILDYAEVFADPHVRERGMVQEMDHPEGGRVRVVGPAVKLSETPARLRRPSPRLGEHTAEVLREIGYPDAEIQALAASGAVALGPVGR
jgi:formyl-CoA transferase